MKLWDLYAKNAVFGGDVDEYRYGLLRGALGQEAKEKVLFVMLNPSTADATRDDPTVRRCIGYARRWGYRDLLVGNIFALRSTDPWVLYQHADPVGPDNDRWLVAMAKQAETVVCAWGEHGAWKDRGREVLTMLRAAGVQPKCLRLSKRGNPGHPLYLPADAELREMP